MKVGLLIEAAVTLCLLLSPAQSLPLSSTNTTQPVLMFQEVWGRSFCRTIEKLVEVVQEYPSEVEYIYSPACVPLVRCSGCCGDENLECHPTHTTNVTMQLLKIRPSDPVQEYVEMTFEEHQTCECRQINSGSAHASLDSIRCFNCLHQKQNHLVACCSHNINRRPRKPVVKERKRQRGRGRKRKEKKKNKECERCQVPRR